MPWLLVSLGSCLSGLILFFLFYLGIGGGTSCKSLPRYVIPTKYFSYNPGVSSISTGTVGSPLHKAGSKMAARKLMWLWVPTESCVSYPLDCARWSWTLGWPLPIPSPSLLFWGVFRTQSRRGWGEIQLPHAGFTQTVDSIWPPLTCKSLRAVIF